MNALHFSAAAALAEAIEADPENRAFALGDPDFERFRETAAFAGVVDPPPDAQHPALTAEGTADGTADIGSGDENS